MVNKASLHRLTNAGTMPDTRLPQHGNRGVYQHLNQAGQHQNALGFRMSPEGASAVGSRQFSTVTRALVITMLVGGSAVQAGENNPFLAKAGDKQVAAGKAEPGETNTSPTSAVPEAREVAEKFPENAMIFRTESGFVWNKEMAEAQEQEFKVTIEITHADGKKQVICIDKDLVEDPRDALGISSEGYLCIDGKKDGGISLHFGSQFVPDGGSVIMWIEDKNGRSPLPEDTNGKPGGLSFPEDRYNGPVSFKIMRAAQGHIILPWNGAKKLPDPDIKGKDAPEVKPQDTEAIRAVRKGMGPVKLVRVMRSKVRTETKVLAFLTEDAQIRTDAARKRMHGVLDRVEAMAQQELDL